MCTCVCDEATVCAVSSCVVYKYLAEFQFASPFRIGREIRTFAFPTPKPLVKTTMTCFISECFLPDQNVQGNRNDERRCTAAYAHDRSCHVLLLDVDFSLVFVFQCCL